MWKLFKTQVSVFDAAVKFDQVLRTGLDYIKKDEEANQTLNTIHLITMVPSNGKYDYKRIPELNRLMAKVKASRFQWGITGMTLLLKD